MSPIDDSSDAHLLHALSHLELARKDTKDLYVVSQRPQQVLNDLIQLDRNISSIQALPNELLLRALSHLELGSQDLVNLCIVSRQFRRVAEDLLYRSIDLTDLERPRIHGLITTLLRHPKLGERVQSLGIHCYDAVSVLERRRKEQSYPARRRRYDLEPDKYVKKCVSHVKRLEQLGDEARPITAPWMCSLERQEPGAFASLLLNLLPNLLYLDIRVLRTGKYGRLDTPNDALLDVIPLPLISKPLMDVAFGNLRQVTHLHVHMNQGDILSFPFPHLQTLEVESTSLTFCTKPPSNTYPSLKTLIVRHDRVSNRSSDRVLDRRQETTADFEHVADLINWLGCFALTSFQLLLSYGQAYSKTHGRNLQAVISNLGVVSHTLEHLKIDIIGQVQANIYTSSDWNNIAFANITPIDSIAHFQNLRSLEIVQVALFKRDYGMGREIHDILPQSLEKITLYVPDGRVYLLLKDLFARIDKFNLEVINLCYRRKRLGMSKHLNKKRRAAELDNFRNRGVVINVVGQACEFLRGR